jgi:hypothetical protein
VVESEDGLLDFIPPDFVRLSAAFLALLQVPTPSQSPHRADVSMAEGGHALDAEDFLQLRLLLLESQRQLQDSERAVQEEQRLRHEEQRLRQEEQRLRQEEARLRQEEVRLRVLAERRAADAEAALGEAGDVPASLGAARYDAVRQRYVKLVIASPSKTASPDRALRPALAVFSGTDAPLVLRGAPPLESLANAFGGARQFGKEHELYELATFAVPSCITAETRSAGAKKNAEALYGPRSQFELPGHFQLPLRCEPELFTRVKAPGDPAFTGEQKSQPEATMNEITTYLALGMMDSNFRVDERRGRRFHAAPPVGYALVGMAQCGYLVGAEWVGKLLIYPLSQPFFLGSPEHAAAVRALDTKPLGADGVVVISDDESATWCTYPATGTPRVLWTHTPTQDGRFWKVIESVAFDDHPEGGAARLRSLFRVHAAYAAALAAADATPADPPPPALVSARLCYGAFALLVDMPYVGEHSAVESQLAAGGSMLDAIAAAVGWLARRGLLYIDLRAPNVRCTDGAAEGGAQPQQAWLVDYDDMLLLSEPLRSVDELVAELARNEHGAAALRRWPALEAALRATWTASDS